LEERILDIQRKKSRLSDAIINVDNDSIPLTGKDLEHLIIDA
jgi:SNF2 family DNA or RNA helicase